MPEPPIPVPIPKQVQALNRECNARLQQKDFAGALAAARRILDLTPDALPAHLRLAAVNMQAGRPERAVGRMRAAVARWPDSAEAHAALARALQRVGKPGAAAPHWRRATELEPESLPYLEHYWRALLEADRLEKAAEVLARAAARTPESADVLANLCRVLIRLNRPAEAREAGQKSLALDPNQQHLTNLLATVRLPGEPQPALTVKALEGGDGFLFHAVDAAFEQMCGEPAKPSHAEAFAAIVARRQAWCAGRDIPYRMLIIPERHVLYDDRLPPGYAAQPERMAIRVLRALPPAARDAVIYPYEAMRAGRDRFPVCYRQDVHWSSFGAYLGYRALLETIPELAAEILPESALVQSIARRVGDMAFWLGLRGREECLMHEPPKAALREVMSTKTFKTGQVDVLETDHPSGRRLVLFRTSNTTGLLPLLAHHFSRIVTLAHTSVSHELVASEAPHYVVSELPERYLAIPLPGGGIRLPDDFATRTFEQETGCALPLPGAG